MSFTYDQIVERFMSTKDVIEIISKRHQEELAPLLKKQEVFKQALLSMLNADGSDSVKTEHGTAYRSTVMSATVDPDGGWDKILEYIFAGVVERVATSLEANEPPEMQVAAFRDTPEMALINRSVNKTAVKEIMEQQDGFIPPGVRTTLITSVNVRRS